MATYFKVITFLEHERQNAADLAFNLSNEWFG
jgi:hypothetical protein